MSDKIDHLKALAKSGYDCDECDDTGYICLGCGMPSSKCTAVSTGCIRNEGRVQQQAKCDCKEST